MRFKTNFVLLQATTENIIYKYKFQIVQNWRKLKIKLNVLSIQDNQADN